MEIWQFDLRRGSSQHPRKGACLLDAVSWFEYGKLGDNPPCVCPVIASFARAVNDLLPDDKRQELKPFILKLSGTVDPAAEQDRAEFFMWQALRVFVPLALEAEALANPAHAIELRDHSGRLRGRMSARDVAAAEAANTAHSAAMARAAAKAARAVDAGYFAASAAVHAARAVGNAAVYIADGSIEDEVYDSTIAALEGVLKIGKQAPAIDVGVINRANRTFSLAQLVGES